AIGEVESDDQDDEDDSDFSDNGPDLSRMEESDLSDSESDVHGNDSDEDEDEDEEEEDIDLEDINSDLEEEDEENVAASARIRQTINNKEGLLAVLRRFQIDTSSSAPFVTHQTVVAKKSTEASIPSIEDDLVRELAFMNQALEAARIARAILRKENVPFTRPTDYFAETLRSDATMELVKNKLIEEATAKKASAEARKQRDLKKFGKQVQVAKQQERAKQKRETLDKITQLKKKRQEGGTSSAVGTKEADDLFDVAIDNELGKTAGGGGGNNKKRSFGGDGDNNRSGGNNKRQKKDSKFGFGGKKRHVKSGDATSSGDLSGFSAKRMKAKPDARPGKSGGAPAGRPAKAPRMGKSRRQGG
ncbi:eukaryotic rRNA processing, partial [Bombardia bombarda]